MLGRTKELAELDGLLTAAMGGAGSVAWVEGPPGIGKSRLLEGAAELASANGMTVALGRADELDQISPWLALLRAFESVKPPIVDGAALQASPDRLDQRGAILETFQDRLERASSRSPLVVLIDDLQWADQATIAALGWLPEHLFSYPVVWLLARRPLPHSSSLEALLARLTHLGAGQWRLGPLDASATMALATQVSDRPINLAPGELHLATGGNPLLVVEVMKGHGLEEGQGELEVDVAHGSSSARTRSTLAAAVQAHLRTLSEPTLELLKVASVLGRQFSLGEASELLGRPAAQLLPAIEEAITGGVLIEEGGQLTFRHDLFREALYSSIPASLRPSLHADAASVLRRNGASATRLAHQLVIGAEAGDRDAIESLYQAVGELVGTSPWPAADLAMRLVDLAPPEAEGRATAVSMAVQLLGWAGRTDEACAVGESFLASSPVSTVTEAEILVGIVRAWLSRHVRLYPRSLPKRVLEDPAIPAGVRATLLAFDQIGPLLRGDLAPADAALDQAAALLAGAGGQLEATAVRSLWVVSAQLRGQFALAIERAQRDLQLVGPKGEPATVAMSESTVAGCLGGLGRIADGLATAERAARAAEASGYPDPLHHCRCMRSAFLLESGRLEDARSEAAAAGDAAFEARHLTFVTFALTTFIELSVRIGDLATADTALERLGRDGEGESINPDPHWAAAMVADAHGRGAMAMRALEPVLAALDEDNFAVATRHPGRLPQIVDLAMRRGEQDTARSVAAAAARLAHSNPGVPVLEQIALHSRGLVERDVASLGAAYELSRTGETRLLHAILTEHLGVLEAEQGCNSEAKASLGEAFDAFNGMGAEHDAARVRADLRKLGVRKRRAAAARPDRGWASLTPAELSVVRVVGNGLTNRAAAAELCLSPDTVNTHLRHAFTKLDIRSRVELARVVASQPG